MPPWTARLEHALARRRINCVDLRAWVVLSFFARRTPNVS